MLRFLVPAVALFASCTQAEPEYRGKAPGGTVDVRFDVCVPTRSSIPAPEDSIGRIELYFYENGSLLPELTVKKSAGGPGGISATVPLGIGHSYEIVALANCSPESVPQTLDGTNGMRYRCSGVSLWKRGLPMACCQTVTAAYPQPPVTLCMTRLAARLNLTVDTSGLEHGSITFSSIKVKQMNRVCPISGRGAATAEGGVCNGDIASAAEIAALNAVGRYTSTFYLLENMQGDILQGNPDPDQKTPDKVTEAGGNPSLCTYLEIAGVYSDRSGHLTGEPFTARLFLGKDATSNFDISRNCRYSVSLAMSDQGCLRSDWKVESNLEDTRVLIFQSSQLSLQTKDAVSVGLDTNLSLSDGDFSYSISGKTGKFTVVTGQSGVTVTPNDAVSVGDAITVTVRTWDGAISSQCKITYIGPPDITWTLDWDEALYVGQRGHIKIKDKQGRNLEGKVFLFDSNNPQMDVSGSGADWYVDAYGPTTQLLGVYFLGNEVGFIPTEIVNPRMGFCSSDIVLPLDGAPVEIGPFYYRRDGSRLYYEDFAPDLYQSLLGFTVTRSCKTIGSKWSKDADKLNPAVGWSNVGNGYVSWEMHLKTLSSNGYLIQQNYSFGSGQVQLEEVTAKIDRANSGIVSCSAKVYTVDPFASSSSFGTADSWTLASWLQLDDHDEVLEYGTESLVADGTDLQYTGLVASPDISPCIPALDAETGITVTLPYSAYATGA
ncbi:MAG: DUF4906 domain-containing protein, partial [Bacteroidales bacterium]|nr:DUF4906 domain-containing protein [Bacteroidales bacterium]